MSALQSGRATLKRLSTSGKRGRDECTVSAPKLPAAATRPPLFITESLNAWTKPETAHYPGMLFKRPLHDRWEALHPDIDAAMDRFGPEKCLSKIVLNKSSEDLANSLLACIEEILVRSLSLSLDHSLALALTGSLSRSHWLTLSLSLSLAHSLAVALAGSLFRSH